MASNPATSYRINSLRAFASENGLFLTLQKVFEAALHRTRDRLLARRLRTCGLRIGKHPKLDGLNHIHMGENFSAGNGLWLHAITSFACHAYHPPIDISPTSNPSAHIPI